MQKSGVMTIILGGISFLLALIAFILDFVVINPAVARLNDIPGISAHWGNVQWFTLPCWLLMLPAFASVVSGATPLALGPLALSGVLTRLLFFFFWLAQLMSPSKNEYQDL
jgi:hypothetical protein